jgi:acyl-CoA synthetase (AMP-forming)/AMP-acid ligase II
MPPSADAQTLVDLLAGQAARHPDAPAIGAPNRPPLSYAALAEQVTLLRECLRRVGVSAGDRVVTVVPNGPEMAVSFLGVAAAATCAPLNPAFRRGEFDFFLDDLKARAVVVQQGVPSPVLEAAAARGIPLVRIQPATDRPEAGRLTVTVELPPTERAAAVDAAPAPDQVALVLHTSGTTARPKMVPLTQSHLVASAGNIATTLQLTADDRCLNVMPLFHIHGLIGAVLSSIRAGASVHCTPGFAAAEFGRWLTDVQPTWYTAVPTIHQAVVERAAVDPSLATTSQLRFIRSSSSSLPPKVMEDLERLFSVPVLEAYGMTEATHQIASNPLPPRARKPGSVGLAAGPEVQVLGDDGRPLPRGQRGDIVIRGPSVITGYIADAETNARAFVDGFLRTGDIGYLDDEGYLFLSGRSKEMINRAGEKVSPREIDEVLLQHPAVAQAVTFAVPHPTLGEDVAAAAVLRPGASATPSELRTFCRMRIADFKVPQQVVIVPEIPKGPTGKPQRIGLHDKLASRLRAGFVAPRDDEEEKLEAIWAEVLKIDQVGVTENFFAVGGDSLKATVIASKAAEQLGIPAELLFQHATIAEIVAAHRAVRGSEAEAEAAPAASQSADQPPATWMIIVGVAVAAAAAALLLFR